jgi:hypothetical protein
MTEVQARWTEADLRRLKLIKKFPIILDFLVRYLLYLRKVQAEVVDKLSVVFRTESDKKCFYVDKTQLLLYCFFQIAYEGVHLATT